MSQIYQINLPKIFILNFGFTTPDPEEAILKKIALDLSEEAFVLADRSKFTETFFSKTSEIKRANIITTNLDDEALTKQYLEKTYLKVVTS